MILSPNDTLYFDWKQSDRKEAKGAFGVTKIEKVYKFSPLPFVQNEKDRALILGAQGNIWTEFMSTPPEVEYMGFPRICALAETVWSNDKNKDFKEFQKRLKLHFRILEHHKIHYFRENR